MTKHTKIFKLKQEVDLNKKKQDEYLLCLIILPKLKYDS